MGDFNRHLERLFINSRCQVNAHLVEWDPHSDKDGVFLLGRWVSDMGLDMFYLDNRCAGKKHILKGGQSKIFSISWCQGKWQDELLRCKWIRQRMECLQCP